MSSGKKVAKFGPEAGRLGKINKYIYAALCGLVLSVLKSSAMASEFP